MTTTLKAKTELDSLVSLLAEHPEVSVGNTRVHLAYHEIRRASSMTPGPKLAKVLESARVELMMHPEYAKGSTKVHYVACKLEGITDELRQERSGA